jgi:hypothetical protein
MIQLEMAGDDLTAPISCFRESSGSSQDPMGRHSQLAKDQLHGIFARSGRIGLFDKV